MTHLSCGDQCIKYSLFVFNFLILLSGLALITIGALGEYFFRTNSMSQHFGSLPIAVIVLGAIIFVISFLGCCGAISNNTCALITYGVILLLLFLAEIVLVGFCVADKNSQIEPAINTTVAKLMLIYGDDIGANQSVDLFQKSLECCGTNGSRTWSISPFMSKTQSVPESCCVDFKPNCGFRKYEDNKLFYKQGCVNATLEFLKKAFTAVIIVLAVIAVILFTGLCFAFRLAHAVRIGKYYAV